MHRHFKTLSLLLALLPTTTLADTYDFGGNDDRFKGGGDKTPPQCQINVPRASTEPFFIKWNCTDDVADPNTIRTELWITRPGDDIAARKIESFLGFPAAAFIDSRQLGVTTFTEGLPASFRLVAVDTAGNAAVSDALAVRAQDTSISQCSVNVITEKTESSGGSSGIPSLRVALLNAPVTTSIENSNVTNIISSTKAATPCEVDLICANGDEIAFTSRVSILNDGTASGTLSIPGSVSTELEGTASVSSGVASSLELNGTTEIDGVNATVTLSCSR